VHLSLSHSEYTCFGAAADGTVGG